MNDSITLITCPTCGADFPLTEALAAPLLEHEKGIHEQKLRQALDQKAEAERKLGEGQAILTLERAKIESEISSRLTIMLAEGEKEQRSKIRAELETELQGAKQRELEVTALLKVRNADVQEALLAKQKAELAAESAKIDAQKQLQSERSKLIEDAERAAQEKEHLKLVEKDGQIQKLLDQLDEAQRQAKQGSQQLQGDVLEIDIEETLRRNFPWDEIEPIKTGQRGGDIVHRIMTAPGLHAGTIMWEIKRTVNWAGDWTAKAKGDAASVKAEIIVILSEAMPKGLDLFGFHEGVWVCKPSFAIAIAHAMRQQIEQVSMARRAAIGKQDKAELLYDYLTGPEFRSRLEGIAEPFVQMQADLESERRATLTRWKKREKQIDRVLRSVTALQGDLQGIGGTEMPKLPAFAELPALESALEDDLLS